MYVHGKIILQILPKIITLYVRACLDDPASILDQFQIEGKPGSRGGIPRSAGVVDAETSFFRYFGNNPLSWWQPEKWSEHSFQRKTLKKPGQVI